MSVQLTEQQAAVVQDRGGELLVSAAAGSGKTRVLVERLLDRVERESLDLDRFLVITYTKAAAAELRGKILDELNARLAAAPGNAALRRQQLLIYRAQISTIHSFCAALLREHGALLELEADFRVAEEMECGVVKERVLSRVLERHYARLAPEDAFSHLLDTMSAGRDDKKLVEMVLDIHQRVQSHPDPGRWLEEQAARFDCSGVRDAAGTPWGRILLDDAREQAEYWRGRMEALLDELAGDAALLAAYGESVGETRDSLDRFACACRGGWDDARDHAEIAFPRLKAAKKAEDEGLKERAKLLREQCKKRMAKVAARFDGSSETLLADLEAVRPAVQTLLALVREFDEAYQAEKRRRHWVDFSDLEHLALRLLVDGAGNETPLAGQYQQRFAEVMVDEYQDTNAVQNAIFSALTGGGRTLFQVGDVKQSIYRFRLADPSIFLEKYRRFPPAGENAPGEARSIVLSKNFRSRASVLAGVNFLFQQVMSVPFGEMEYSADQRLYPGLSYPEHPDDRVELDVLDLGGVEQDPNAARRSRDAFEADYVAWRVRQVLDSGFPVTEGGALRPVRPEDIVILYRSPGAVMRHLRRALDRRRIPWSADSDADLLETEEVRCALAFLEIVDNPRQDIPLLAALTSPVWGMSGDRLAQLRSQCPQGDLYTCLKAGETRGEADCRAILAALSRLRQSAVDQSGRRILREIYDQLGLMTVYSALEGGAQRQANLRALYDAVCRLEQSGHQGVFGLTSYFRALREKGERIPVGGEQGAGVRVMSIHKSKGLEFPVVILAGLNRSFNRMDQHAPILFHPRLGVGPKGVDAARRIEYETLARRTVALQLEREMKAEELRLLYVAMTRAREKLILIAAFRDWARDLARLAPDAGERPEPQALHAQGSMAQWMLLPVLARPDALPLRAGSGVLIPTLIPEDRWDIRLVTPQEEGAVSTAPQSRPQQEEAAPALTEADIARICWRYPMQSLVNAPSKVTATQMKGRELDAEAAASAVVPAREGRADREFTRPRFDRADRALTPTQVGTAFHTVMQLLDLKTGGTAEGVRRQIEEMVQRACLTPEQAERVEPEQVAAFVRSPWGAAAAGAQDLRREFKFSILIPADRYDPALPGEEQVLLQGVVDCCYTGDDGMTVIDFKTDHVRPGEEAAHSQRYRPQVEAYARALEEIFGAPVKHRVLWYLSTGMAAEL